MPATAELYLTQQPRQRPPILKLVRGPRKPIEDSSHSLRKWPPMKTPSHLDALTEIVGEQVDVYTPMNVVAHIWYRERLAQDLAGPTYNLLRIMWWGVTDTEDHELLIDEAHHTKERTELARRGVLESIGLEAIVLSQQCQPDPIFLPNSPTLECIYYG